MLPILNLGPLAIQTPGLILLFGIWLGLVWAERVARQTDFDVDGLYSLALWAFLAGVLGARLSYALQNLAVFINNPLDLFALSAQMLDIVGGVMVGVLAALIYGQRRGLPLWQTLDVLAPGFALFMVFVGLMNLASGDVFGLPARLPWSIFLYGEWRHPTQVYQIILAVIVFLLVNPGKIGGKLPPGVRFLFFLATSGISVIIVEAFRGESILLAGSPIRVSQAGAWLILSLSLWRIHKILQRVSSQPQQMKEDSG
ncbi:MAG: prolipoprotein diacylglyceryl transferase [Bellilinea sp.]|jgi:prolipoprotein diacylglyceryl transferase